MMTHETSEEQLLEFLYACPVGLIDCDLTGEISLMNPHAMQHLLPLAGARDTGNLFTALEQHAPEIRNIVAAFVPATGRICDGYRIFVDLGAGARAAPPKILSCTLVKLGPDRMMATLSDVSQQVVREQRLLQADAWFAALLDEVDDYGAVTTDRTGLILSANATFTGETEYDAASIIGRNLADVLGNVVASGDLRLDEQFVIAAHEGWHLQEGWQFRATGTRFWCQRLVVARSDDGEGAPSGFSVILRDVPRRETVAEDVRRLLTRDHLTGAANRRHFGQVLDREATHWRKLRQPVSLVALDLDHFKQVNDSHGHPTGDLLLRHVADACAALLPPRGVFARIGGEEFGVLLPRHDLAQAVALAEDMRAAIARIEVAIPGGVVRTTASLGCATLDEANGSPEALMALADKRLYAAKNAGRNRVHRPLDQAA